MIKELNKVSFKKLILFSLITIGGSLVNFIFTDMQSATASGSVLVDKIEQSDGWGVIAVDPYTFKVYVTNFKSTTVTVIDGTTNTPLSVINVGRTPYGLGINTDTKLLYVALEYNDTLVIVNTTTNEIVKTFDVNDPCGIGVNEATNMVYVTSESSNKLHVIDGATNNLMTSIDVGKSPRGIVANPRTNMLYVTNQLSGTVDVIDGAQNKIVDTITVGTTPR